MVGVEVLVPELYSGTFKSPTLVEREVWKKKGRSPMAAASLTQKLRAEVRDAALTPCVCSVFTRAWIKSRALNWDR
jgi:hypothetical protein